MLVRQLYHPVGTVPIGSYGTHLIFLLPLVSRPFLSFVHFTIDPHAGAAVFCTPRSTLFLSGPVSFLPIIVPKPMEVR